MRRRPMATYQWIGKRQGFRVQGMKYLESDTAYDFPGKRQLLCRIAEQRVKRGLLVGCALILFVLGVWLLI
jgi:hypothetical protein